MPGLPTGSERRTIIYARLECFYFDVPVPDGGAMVLKGDLAAFCDAEIRPMFEFTMRDHIAPMIIPQGGGHYIDTIEK